MNQATSSAAEQTFVENPFGTVTSKRVIYYREKRWFSGGSREDIPLPHVTSVRLETSRSIFWAFIFLLVGLGLVLNGHAGSMLAGLFLILWASVLLWGSPVVIVNTAGNDRSAARGFPWHRNQARDFVDALRKQLFKSGD